MISFAIKNILIFMEKKIILNNPVFQYLMIIIVGFGLYFQTINFDWSGLDDKGIILNNYEELIKPSAISEAFKRDAFFSSENKPYYRPLQTVSFILDANIGSKNASIFHFTNIILHILNCCLILILFKKLNFNYIFSLIFTLFFTVHPLFNHSVCWIPARGDLLLTMFFLFSFISLVKYYEKRNIIFYIIHILTFLFSVFTKETAIFTIFIFLFYLLFIKKEKIANIHNLLLPAFYILIIALYYILRNEVINNELDESNFGILPFLTNFPVISELLLKIIFPINLTPMPRFSEINTVLGSIFILLFFLLYFYSKENRKILIFSLFWFIILILPPMFYRHNLADFGFEYMEHRAYLPSIGIFIYLLSIVNEKIINKNIKIFMLFSAIIIIFLFVYSDKHSEVYSDVYSFYDYVIENDAENELALSNRAYNKALNGNFNGAIVDLNEAIRINPKDAVAFWNRGNAKNSLGNKTGALEDYNNAILLNDKEAEIFFVRGTLKGMSSDLNGAVSDLTKAINLDNKLSKAYFNRGIAYLQLKDTISAKKDWEIANKLGYRKN